MTTPAPRVQLPDDFFRRAYEIYPSLREAGGVHEVTFPGGGTAILVTDYKLARQALGEDSLRKNPAATDSPEVKEFAELTLPAMALDERLPWSDPPEHARLRALVADAFTPRTVAALAPRVHEIAEQLLSGIDADDEPVDLLGAYATPLPVQVICEILGVPAEDHQQFGDWVHTMLLSQNPGRERARAGRNFAMYLMEQVRRRRQQPDLASWTPDDPLPGDLLGTLTIRCDAAVAADPATAGLPAEQRIAAADQAIATNTTVLLAAGYETTRGLIANSVMLLTPEIRDELAAHPERIDTYVEEVLRILSPGPFATLRYTTAPLSLGQVEIPPGRVVIVGLGAANTDPAVFDDPLRVRLDHRNGPAHLAFGLGMHYCIGARLARLEGQVALRALLARFPAVSLAAARTDVPTTESILTAAPLRLPVRLTSARV
ncbi:cytochrome P450 [Nocardia stercoris]|uniref:Cytochrome P450 n=1 Tax=Nocardia stercoris TaxID=2483361 RepID=A0A3M2L5K7_9NOCA|nr:cytochrome P450 [Nocardia stercoris]RMI32891.1 cytochrome P450 [Nocardia stercoris]